jgi:ACT domain-containing protein
MEDYLNTALKIKESQGLINIKDAFGALEKSGVSISNFYKPKEATDKYKFVDGVMKKVE